MVKFGLACEGITDHIVIENILCGFYKDYDDLDEEIQAFQPAYDETTKKQKEQEFGGWEILLDYLSEKRFRDDVLNSEYTIVQIDTDICEHVNFNVPKETIPMMTFIEKIQERLILSIDKNKLFYDENKDKIIFAISVHMLECWLFPIYKDCKTEKIVGCFEALKREVKTIKVQKNRESYQLLSKPLLKRGYLLEIAKKNCSFYKFLKDLPTDIT